MSDSVRDNGVQNGRLNDNGANAGNGEEGVDLGANIWPGQSPLLPVAVLRFTDPFLSLSSRGKWTREHGAARRLGKIDSDGGRGALH